MSRSTPRSGTALTINGAQTFQTIDGFGVNLNSLSWKNGELAPVLDMLVDQLGATTWRVVFDMEDWESANDNTDPSVAELDVLQRALFEREVPEPVGHASLPEPER